MWKGFRLFVVVAGFGRYGRRTVVVQGTCAGVDGIVIVTVTVS